MKLKTLLAVCLLGIGSAYANEKVVLIDPDTLFKENPLYKNMAENLNKEMEAKIQELRKDQEYIKNTQNDLNDQKKVIELKAQDLKTKTLKRQIKKVDAINEKKAIAEMKKEWEAKVKSLEDTVKLFEEKQNVFQQDLKKAEENYKNKIKDDILVKTRMYIKKNNLNVDMVLNKKIMEDSGALLILDKDADLTPKIVEEMYKTQ